MSEPETAGHVHNGDEPGHVHDLHECDEHEHHADDGDKELVATG